MGYKYGDRIMVGENPEFAPEGKALVVGIEPENFYTVVYHLDELGHASTWFVRPEYVTPLDNEE